MRRLTLCCLLLLGIATQIVTVQPSAARPSPARTSAPAAEANGTLSVNGYARHFVYDVSAAPAPASGRPLVIYLHGDEGAPTLYPQLKQAVLGDANGAVLLGAEGRNNIAAAAAIDGSAWRFRMDEGGKPYDDVDFINQLITQATASSQLLGTTIDPKQVYLFGLSRGAGFAYYLYADPRTRNKIRAIVPISGTFYCSNGDGDPNPQPDTVCGEGQGDDFGPKAALFTPPGVTRPAHILDIHGQLDEPDTAPPALDVDYGSYTWTGWADAAGCYSVKVSKATEQTLPQPVAGQTVKTYAYSQSENSLATRCANLDLTFYIVQGAGHVPGGFEPTAWCYLSTTGGTPSSTACAGSQPPANPQTNGPALSVNAGVARKPISDDIYGMHEADEAFAREIGLPVRRDGGNLATRYNWKNNSTNSGLDYYFANREADVSADDFVAQNKRTGTKSIITVPMTGWVAKDGDNATCGFSVQKYNYTPQPFGGAPAVNPDYPQCGTGVTRTTPGGTTQFYKPVDPRDTSVPFAPADAQAWIAHLKQTFGAAQADGVALYSLDNEPDLWSETHADVVPTAKKYQEFRTYLL